MSPHREVIEDQIRRIVSNLESELLQFLQINFLDQDDIDSYDDSNILQELLNRYISSSDDISNVSIDELKIS